MIKSKAPALRMTRRAVLGAFATAAVRGGKTVATQERTIRYQLPLGLPGMIPGDGCYIRHGYACENVGFNTGWWHTGENWYTIEGNSAGALVYAVSSGEVVYADADYPGRVVIIRHDDGLYSMYGHLDYDLAVTVGDTVDRGTVIGEVLFRTDTRSPSHLHFEIRSFLLDPVINGSTPRYQFACGVNCPPGPGYWPMGDPDHPSDLGWMNPMHVIARRMLDGNPVADLQVVTAAGAPGELALLSKPGNEQDAEQIGLLRANRGDYFGLLDIAAGAERSRGTSADAYDVWYQIEAAGATGWVEAFTPDVSVPASDGRPSALQLNFIVLP